MSYEFRVDAMCRTARRNRQWYHERQLPLLHALKDMRVRDIDVSIALAERLIQLLDEKCEPPVVVTPREVTPAEDGQLMWPAAPEIVHLLYGSTEKGATERYLRARNKLRPEDKYVCREVTSWDYGWKQRESPLCARSVHRGRRAVLRDTFYRANNLAPDPPCTMQPATNDVSVCSQYQCYSN